MATRAEAIERYKAWVLEQPELLERIRRELRGKILGCWCAPRPCYGEVLAYIANELPRPEGGWTGKSRPEGAGGHIALF